VYASVCVQCMSLSVCVCVCVCVCASLTLSIYVCVCMPVSADDPRICSFLPSKIWYFSRSTCVHFLTFMRAVFGLSDSNGKMKKNNFWSTQKWSKRKKPQTVPGASADRARVSKERHQHSKRMNRAKSLHNEPYLSRNQRRRQDIRFSTTLLTVQSRSLHLKTRSGREKERLWIIYQKVCLNDQLRSPRIKETYSVSPKFEAYTIWIFSREFLFSHSFPSRNKSTKMTKLKSPKSNGRALRVFLGPHIFTEIPWCSISRWT